MTQTTNITKSHHYTTTNSYPQQSQPPEPTSSIHPPGVPVVPDQNAYYPPQSQGSVENQQLLDPAAAAASVAALPQQPVHPPIGQSPYRGGGRRGGRPFRGGGRGHFGPRLDGSSPPFRGRGRGQGGGRHFPSHGAATTTTTASAPAEGGAALMQLPSASVSGQAPLPVPAQVPAAPFWPPPRMAWCELCRVDCNTLEILEQHKNGKRHKKNLQVNEELQRLNKVITGQQNLQMPNSELKQEVVQPEKVEEFETPPENLTSESVTDGNRKDTEQQIEAVGNSEVLAVEPERKLHDHFAARGHGFKRKMRGSRGGKYMRTYEGSRRPVEPPKPKQVVPLICELCNVKCDSQVVFNSHLIGKKHLANLKRFHGHRALYGEVGLQALYPPNFNAPSEQGQTGLQAVYPPNFNAPLTSLTPQQQGVNDPQLLLAQLLMTYVLSQAQAPALVQEAGTLASAAVPPPPASGSILETQYQQGFETPGSGDTSEVGIQNAGMTEGKSQPQPIRTESEVPTTLNANTKTENGNSESVKEASLPSDNSVMTPLDNPSVLAEQVGSATKIDEVAPIPGSEVSP
uniref:U1-type domain-containing protein n=1 Tax=Fagus sylvatica TaxID=28930 RepID=A0A2N9GJ48_FAGSY